MTLSVDLFWSFRSPYSYLVAPRMGDLERRYYLEVRVRPVYPIAVRIENFFKTVNPMFAPYLLIDSAREAEQLGMPIAWPSPDPVQMDMATGEVPKEQPYIHRLTRLGVAATEAGKGLPFITEVSRIIFGGQRDWHEGDHLHAAAERAGLNLDYLDTVIEADPDRFENIITENEAAQKAAGHWGVPLMVFDGEPFFGQDRVDALVWRMRQNGLQERS